MTVQDTVLYLLPDGSSELELEENAALLIKHLIFNNSLKFMILYAHSVHKPRTLLPDKARTDLFPKN